VTSEADASSPWHQGHVLNVEYERPWLLQYKTRPLKSFYSLPRDGEDFSVQLYASIAPRPWENPIASKAELRVSVESIRQAIQRSKIEATFDENEPLQLYGVNKLKFQKPILPGHNHTHAELPYDTPSRKFAIIRNDFGRWTGILTKYDVPIEGTTRMEWYVDPDKFPVLKERALSGQPIVIRPEDCVSSLSGPFGVPFADHVSPPNRVKAQLAIDDAAAWASSNWNMCAREWSTGRWTLHMSLSVVYVIHQSR